MIVSEKCGWHSQLLHSNGVWFMDLRSLRLLWVIGCFYKSQFIVFGHQCLYISCFGSLICIFIYILFIYLFYVFHLILCTSYVLWMFMVFWFNFESYGGLCYLWRFWKIQNWPKHCENVTIINSIDYGILIEKC